MNAAAGFVAVSEVDPWRARRAEVESTVEALSDPAQAVPAWVRIESLASDPKWEVRHEVAHQLRRMPRQQVEPLAIRLQKDTNAFVRRAAERALAERRKADQVEARRLRTLASTRKRLASIEQHHGSRAAQSARALADGQFAEIVGATVHEMRSILTPIVSVVQTIDLQLATGDVDAAYLRKHTPRLRDRLSFLEYLLDDMRAYALPVPQSRYPENLGHLVEKAEQLAVEWFASRDLDIGAITIERVVTASIIVEVDRLAMITALRNLIKNAIESLASGPRSFRQGKIRIQAEAKDGRAILSVADTGIGLSAVELEELRSFLPGRSTKKAHGTGFGLPIACRRVREHGGDLTVESRLDRGTVITMTIPITQSTR